MSKILICDDEKNIRNVVREYAEFEGYEVFEAEDGMSAVDMCRKENFDLIVMDVMMPRLDGFSYFVYFTSCLTKITVCIFIIRYILKNCNLLLKNTNFYTN